MNQQTENYLEAVKRWPANGQHILGYQADGNIVVYQAYNKRIADYAIKNQGLGGADFSYNRMSWIKPNFLWMMYRCGWATKENQERVLAITISKDDFESILKEATFSSFSTEHYASHDQWKNELAAKEGRLQWDPDHDPFGNKVTRRAIQLGLKGKLLEKFGKEQIRSIEDITDFVKVQKQFVDHNELDKLSVPIENIYLPADNAISHRIGIS